MPPISSQRPSSSDAAAVDAGRRPERAFDYREAFSRNIGWVTEREQAILQRKRVAIAGMGGVGGSHLLTMTRLGVGRFHVADFDRFELANANRQAGASQRHLGRPKVDVMSELARDINPELHIRAFDRGISLANLGDFLSGVDLFVDGLDFFELEIRRAVFAACAERGIPAITAAPLGMSTALLVFLPGAMSFEEYFRLEGVPKQEQLLRFAVGLAPAGLHLGALVEPSAIDMVRRRGPSTAMACELCAGVAGSAALKILLRRGPVHAAPSALQFDAFRGRAVRTRRSAHHPLRRLALAVGRRALARGERQRSLASGAHAGAGAAASASVGS